MQKPSSCRDGAAGLHGQRGQHPFPSPWCPLPSQTEQKGLPQPLAKQAPPPPLCCPPLPLGDLSLPAQPQPQPAAPGWWWPVHGLPCVAKAASRAGPGRERYGEVWRHRAGTGAAGLASRWCFPRGWGRAGCTGSRTGAGRSGASRLHRSCFLHIFVHECEEFPHPAGAGGSPREVRGSSSCRVSLSRWENHPKDCGDPYHREGSQSWCMSQGTVGPRAVPSAGKSRLAAQRHRRFM